MAQYSPIQINYNPQLTYPGTQQDNYIGAQTVAGQRGTLPTFTNSNSLFVGGTGASDSTGTGTMALPFKTIQHVFATTANLDLDVSGNSASLVQTGVVPALTYPANPIPAQGNTSAGPFSTTQYFNVPTGTSSLSSKITAAGVFTFECYFYLNSLSALSVLFQYIETGGNNTGLYINTNGDVQFNVYSNNLITAAGLIVAGQWYHIACTYDGTVQKIYLNGSLIISSPTFTHTIGTITTHTLGIDVTATNPNHGYINRVVYSTFPRSSFPTQRGVSNIIGFYNFQTDPLMFSSSLQYVVIQDSGLYNQRIFINFPDDLSNIGIYAADGQAPTIQVIRGAVPQTYGAGNPSRTSFSGAPTADTLYVSYAGSDSTGVRGSSSHPFRTISAALAYNGSRGGGATSNGDTVQIQDSNLYHEDINFGTLTTITIQAAAGQTPVLTNVNVSSTAFHLQAAGTAINFFYGLTFQDSGLGAVVGPGAGYNFSDCTFSSASGNLMNFVAFSNTASVLPGAFSLTNSFLFKMSLTQPATSTITSSYQNFQNSYFKACNLGEITSATTSGFTTPYTVSCTFDACGSVQALYFDPGTTYLPMSFQQCLFLNSSLQIMALASAVIGRNWVVNSDFINGSCGTKSISGITGGGILRTTVENCLVQNGSFWAWITSTGTNYVTFQNCTALFSPGGAGGGGYYANQASGTVVNINILNSCSVGSASYGIDVATVTSASASAFLENGSATEPWTGLTPTFSESNAGIINSGSGLANTALTPADGANLGGSNVGLTNIGVESAVIQVNIPGFTLNGLTITGSSNRENGINSLGSVFYPLGTQFNVAFCTFNGLGNYGIRSAQFGQSYTNIFFNTNGYGIQLSGQGNSVTYCVFNECASAGVANYGHSNAFSNLTAYGCLYGQYDQFGAYSLNDQNNVFSGSGAFDYSGDNIQSYSCIGTLDPSRVGSLGSFSTSLDPLFQNIAAGDLNLQTVEEGFFFNSPAKLGGSDGYDMGAYKMTYGALVPVWTNLTLINNPDQVQKTQSVIKLAEGDTEGGNLYSKGQAFQILYQFIWNENNPMPVADLTGLTSVYTSATGQCQISFDGGATWAPVRVVRSQGFEWTDLDMMFNDNQKPTPLREIDFRISA